MTIQTATVIFPHRRHSAAGELKLVAKRYVPGSPSLNGPTLLFAHCTGSHKEVWEPTIEHLFQFKDGTGMCLVREAWSFDAQNAGEGAVVNTAVLGDKNIVSLSDLADGVKAFVASGKLDGHQLVAIGHSAGSCLVGLTTGGDGYPAIHYKAVILVEPSIATKEACFENREEQLMGIRFMIKSISKRRNFWPGREEARAFFAKRVPWQLWHPRILDLFVQHALRDITGKDTQAGANKVTLCCTPKQEWSQYEHEELHYRATELLARVDPSTPIYLVLAERVDFIPQWSYDSLPKRLNIASVHTVPEAGHFVVQENPIGVANILAEILDKTFSPTAKARM
ncbi:alpha/beta-hydrolase [Dichomitus squalens]|uniref:Alpha/beta-hydrolase n=1 Tax=Dichomitus squalens TaxID=114155 RepID=A0A4V2K0F2_9APHY|nr:alpha/beta-hydrolase [Dichomitus squalens]